MANMPGPMAQSGWTLALMKILLMVFDFALWVCYCYNYSWVHIVCICYLYLFNDILNCLYFQVFGCAVLATGIWMKLEAHKYLDIDPSNPVTSHVAIFFMSIGVAIALVGLLSCYCTLSGNPILLYLVILPYYSFHFLIIISILFIIVS